MVDSFRWVAPFDDALEASLPFFHIEKETPESEGRILRWKRASGPSAASRATPEYTPGKRRTRAPHPKHTTDSYALNQSTGTYSHFSLEKLL